MRYSFKCAACGKVISEGAPDTERAMDKLMRLGVIHVQGHRRDGPSISLTEIRDMVRAHLQRA